MSLGSIAKLKGSFVKAGMLRDSAKVNTVVLPVGNGEAAG